LPDVVGALVDMKEEFLTSIEITASRISSRNSSVFWESERNVDYVHSFLKREREVEGNTDPELLNWLDAFQKDRREASLSYWYEMHKGVHESLREF
ncbi:MAG: aldehyde ferredoxin oxidoreductase, partial [Desulfobacterales bacterium]|nr:aldehyde ferredoxin oxidoreductase [Desulfobacterales bacterium]